MADSETTQPNGTQPGDQAAEVASGNGEADGLRKAIAAERAKKRELETRLAALEEEKKTAELKRQQEQGNWQAIAQAKEAEAVEARKRAEQLQANQEQILIKAELRARLGDIAKPEYLKLFDASGLKVEGEAVQGIEEAVAGFRKSNPELFKTFQPSRDPAGVHPPTAGKPTPEKPLDKMTAAERFAYTMASLKQQVDGGR